MVCVRFLRTQQRAKSQCIFLYATYLVRGYAMDRRVLRVFLVALFVGVAGVGAFNGEFDPGSGRTLAACLTHASRAERPFGVLERRTGE